MHQYFIYGLGLYSDFQLPQLVPIKKSISTDIVLNTAPDYVFEQDSQLIFSSRTQNKTGIPVITLHKNADYIIYSNLGTPYFAINLAGDTISFRTRIEFNEYHSSTFLNTILNMVLELRGEPCLHGSAIKAGHQAMGFLGASGSGKSTMALSLLLAGHELISDDLIRTEQVGNKILIHPGYFGLGISQDTKMKYKDLLPESAMDFEYTKKKILFHQHKIFKFANSVTELKTLFLLNRGNFDKVKLDKIDSPPDKLLRINSHGMPDRLSIPLSMINNKLTTFSRLSSNIDLYELSYPDDLNRINEAHRHILNCLSN